MTPPGEARVRHSKGLPWAADRADLPRPSVALLTEVSDGFLLIRLTSDGAFCGDTWHPTANDARGQAEFEFDRVGTWHELPADVADPQAYAIRHATLA